MSLHNALACAGSLLFAALAHAAGPGPRPAFQWERLAPIPDAEGFAGTFAGESAGALLVAGGANFPDARSASHPLKTWHSRVFVLEKATGRWIVGGNLPRPLAYGVFATTDAGLLCAGGSDERQHTRETFTLQWKDGGLLCHPLPELPRACANACGAVVGRTLYVAGGAEAPDSTTALNQLLALDLDALERGWRELEPLPGPGRILAVAGASNGAFFVFSGASLHAGSDGKPVRRYLTDAFRYDPGLGWRRLKDLPRAAVGAPSPAPCMRDEQLLLMGGDDGSSAGFEPGQHHPGFSRQLLAYDPAADQWLDKGALPFATVTAPAVKWGGLSVIPNGEIRPRIRTPDVWSLCVKETQ